MSSASGKARSSKDASSSSSSNQHRTILKRKRTVTSTRTGSSEAPTTGARKSEETSSNKPSKKKSDGTAKDNQSSPTEALPFGACISVSQNFRKVCRIGEGTYGIVYKAERRQKAGDFVALKRCTPHHEATDGFPMTTLREIQSLRLLQHHPHVVSLRTDIGMVAVSKSDTKYLVFEYCEHDLSNLLDYHYQKQRNPRGQGGIFASTTNKPSSPFRETHVKTLMNHLLSALECMHNNRLIHRDIKVSNLLYTASGHLKLADLGLSRSLPSTKTEDGGYHLTLNVVSLWYRPPELLLGSPTYNQSIDMWGAGCVFAELLLGHPLWMGKTESEQIQAIFSKIGPPSLESWPSAMSMPKIQNGSVSLEGHTKVKTSTMPLLDSFSYLSTSGLMLLAHLLHYDANNQRLTATKALQSSYFTSEPLPTPPKDMPKFKSLHTGSAKK